MEQIIGACNIDQEILNFKINYLIERQNSKNFLFLFPNVKKFCRVWFRTSWTAVKTGRRRFHESFSFNFRFAIVCWSLNFYPHTLRVLTIKMTLCDVWIGRRLIQLMKSKISFQFYKNSLSFRKSFVIIVTMCQKQDFRIIIIIILYVEIVGAEPLA